MQHYKYIHIAWQNDIKFVAGLNKMIHEQVDYFDAKEHYVVTPHERTFNAMKEYGNVELVADGNLIKRYAPHCDLLIVHALNSPLISSFVFTPKKYMQKTVWRTWGHDVMAQDFRKTKGLWKNIRRVIKNILIKARNQKCKQFLAVGIANAIDAYAIRKTYGDMYTFRVPYGHRTECKDRLGEMAKEERLDSRIRIMVGHSGFEGEDHIEILNRLHKYRGENWVISIPLVYGDSEYIEKVKAEATRLFGNQVEVLSTYMSYYEYAKYIQSVDVAILATKHSNALGNVFLLSYFGKKMYFNRDGDIAQTLLSLGIKVNTIDEIGDIPETEFLFYDGATQQAMKAEFGGFKSREEKCGNLEKELEHLSSLNNKSTIYVRK